MNLTSLKCCTEKILPEHQEIIDNIHSVKNKANVKQLRAAFYKNKLWPQNASIKVGFLSTDPDIPHTTSFVRNNLDPLQKTILDEFKSKSIPEMIKQIVIERIQPLVNLQFIFVDKPEDADIRVSFDKNGGAWSLVGTDCLTEDKTKATMNLGWFDVPTIIHEFCHSIGMIHEHQNPHGQGIKWNKPRVYEWAKQTQGWDKETVNTNIIGRYDIDQINGSEFDPLSIMLYFFPGFLTENNQGTHQNLRYSGEDVEWITKIYPIKEDPLSVAETFYKNTYQQTLQASIQQSNAELAKIASGSSTTHNTTAIFLVLTFIVVLLVLRKKKMI